jgi:hypothetical protein
VTIPSTNCQLSEPRMSGSQRPSAHDRLGKTYHIQFEALVSDRSRIQRAASQQVK